MVHRFEQLLEAWKSGTRPVVKVCGLQGSSHAQAAVDAGADMIGFVLAPSRRRTTPSAVRAIRGFLQSMGPPPIVVGVFVNESSAVINEAVDLAGLDAVQLAGDEHPDLVREIHAPIIKAIRPRAGVAASELLRDADSWLDRAYPAALLLVDSHHPGSYGGSGAIADWAAAALLARKYPVLLAGGLTPDNVGEAIAAVGPLGVDVSSGVEVAGVKRPERIAAFIAAAHAMNSVTR